MAKKKMTLEEKLEKSIVKDVPYEVPENWVWTNLEVIFDNVTSSKKKLKQKEYESECKEGYIEVIDQGESFIGGYTDKKELAYDGELPVIIFGDHSKCIKFVNFNFVQGADGVKVLLPKGMNRRYLYYMMKNLKLPDKGYSRHYKFLREEPMPIAPLREQQRIVDKIESLFKKLDKAKELIEESRDDFEKRKSAILEKAFRGELTKEWRANNRNKILGKAELFNQIKEVRFSLITSNKERKEIESIFNDYKYIDETLPDGWIKLKSAMVCELISCGKTPTGSIVEKGEVAYLKVYNIVNNKIDFEYKQQFIDYETHSTKLKNSMLRPNDVIMNIVGPPLKKIAIIPETYKDWNMNQALVRFRTINCIDYKYYYYCLLYDDTLKDVINATRGVVGQANISVSQSRNLEIIVPSVEEQKEIVRILDDLLGKEFKIEELIDLEEQIELIKKSILAKAFRGQLGTNCEEDESALELLKEIVNT